MDQDNSRPTPQGFIKSMSVIHLALLAGQVVFGIVAFAQSGKVYFGIRDTGDVLIFIVPVVAIGGFVAGYVLFQQQLIALRNKNSFGEKIIGYQTALIVRFALLEGPSLLAIVAYLLNGNLYYLSIAGLLVLYFLTLRPTLEKVENDLDLNFTERIEFLDKDDLIK
jgi:hypothetical protein